MSKPLSGLSKKFKPSLEKIRVYLITDRTLVPEKDFFSGIEAALSGGVRAIQLREKDLAPSQLLPLAREVKMLTRKYDAQLFINDRVDVAVMSGAEGVHLTEASLPVFEVRKHYPQLLLGVSTHSLDKARRAEEEGADFITFSPIFDTVSKREYGPPQGLEKLREVTQDVRIPVLALGGIREENVPAVLEHGAFGIALISGIWKSSHIENESVKYMQYFQQESSHE